MLFCKKRILYKTGQIKQPVGVTRRAINQCISHAHILVDSKPSRGYIMHLPMWQVFICTAIWFCAQGFQPSHGALRFVVQKKQAILRFRKMDSAIRASLVALVLTLIVHEVDATYNFVLGATQCYACQAGTFSTAASGTCSSCEAGYYQDSGTSSSCKPCPEGRVQ